MDLFNAFGENSAVITEMMITHGLNLIGAILLLIIGYLLAGWAERKAMKSATKSEKFEDTLVPILGKITKFTILIITLLVVLGQFGVQTASFIAVLGAAGLAIGLALQGTLSNVASGMMLLTLRPFKVGDAVEIGGTTGVVDEIGFFTTEMHTFDNIGVTMPNSRVWGDEIKNLSRFDTRRVDMEFGIDYSDDMDKAIRLVKEVLEEDDRILPEPEPLIAVSELGDSSVSIRVRPWANTSDVWPLRYDLTKRMKEKFDENDVSFPFPQRDVHLFQNN